jgi:hypothetical protein
MSEGLAHRFRHLLPWSVAAIPAILVIAIGASLTATTQPAVSSPPGELAPVDSFNAIKDPAERSAALFVEAAKVLESPRCMNCHPATRSPTQGDDKHPHIPPIASETAIMGNGMPCMTCHQAENVSTPGAGIPSIPGNAHWGLAPAEMAWQGLTTGEICEQIQDPKRNGNRSLADIKKHLAEDHLVGWAWSPGEGRTPAPGTQDQFGELVAAWIETGAKCPK